MDSSALYARYQRAKTQRIEIISSAHEFFVVRGSSGIVYNVWIDGGFYCSCPDAESAHRRGVPLCKHRILVLIHTYGLGWEEIESLAEDLWDTGTFDSTLKVKSVKKVDPRETDDCVICLGPLSQQITRSTVYCKAQCGTIFHKECLDSWLGHSNQCPTCRTPWLK